MKKFFLILFLMMLGVIIYFLPKAMNIFNHYKNIQNEMVTKQEVVTMLQNEIVAKEKEIREIQTRLEELKTKNLVYEYNVLAGSYDEKMIEYNRLGEEYKKNISEYEKLNNQIMNDIKKRFGWLGVFGSTKK